MKLIIDNDGTILFYRDKEKLANHTLKIEALQGYKGQCFLSFCFNKKYTYPEIKKV
jgi:hypothetical protein